MRKSRSVVVLCLLLSVSPLALAQQSRPDAAELIKQRREMMTNMLSNGHKLERMVYGMIPYNAAEAKQTAANLVQLSGQVFQLFPPGSTGADSKARPELWQQADEFNKLSAACRVSITELAAAAEKGGLDQLKSAYAKVPPTCVACHQTFRVGG